MACGRGKGEVGAGQQLTYYVLQIVPPSGLPGFPYNQVALVQGFPCNLSNLATWQPGNLGNPYNLSQTPRLTAAPGVNQILHFAHFL